jgi:hypothetical protein
MSPAEVIAHAMLGLMSPRASWDNQWKSVQRTLTDDAGVILAALDAAGLAVVPKEPTRQMIDALRGYAQCAGYTPKTYRAMVAVEQATKEGE